MSNTVIIEVERKCECVARLTFETEKGTQYAIALLSDEGENFHVPGADAYNAFPVGSGLKFEAKLQHLSDMGDNPGQGIKP